MEAIEPLAEDCELENTAVAWWTSDSGDGAFAFEIGPDVTDVSFEWVRPRIMAGDYMVSVRGPDVELFNESAVGVITPGGTVVRFGEVGATGEKIVVGAYSLVASVRGAAVDGHLQVIATRCA